MFDFWIKLKVWTEFIIPAAFLVLVCAIYVAAACISSFRWNRKIKWLKQNGYERFLRDVSSYGGKAFYAWKKEGNKKIIDERNLKHWSYKYLKNITE